MIGRPRAASHRIVVLESPLALRPTTNPYIKQLVAALRADTRVRVHLFSFRRAIFGQYDVFHVHWPETLINGNGLLKTWRRRVLMLLVLLRLLVTRTPVVRTWHNLDRPEGLSRFDYFLLDLADRATTLRIALNPLSSFPDDKPCVVIPHGHYRDWYKFDPSRTPVAGQIGYVGLIRRYKGVESLVSAFRELPDEALSLHIAGKPSTDDLVGHLIELSDGDARISFDFRFLSDDEFADSVRDSSVVVLPYRHMHNSGTVLAVLSLGRPALVPDNAMNRMLAAEVGSGWLSFFTDELSADVLADAMASASRIPAGSMPELSGRDWDTAADAHIAAFTQALALARKA